MASSETNMRQRRQRQEQSEGIEGGNTRGTVELKKEIGMISGIALVVGTMIGAGIFISPTLILTNAKSVGASLCVWTGCGALATLGALCYIELGLMIRQSGAEYPYLREAYGDLVAFIYIWTTVIVLKPADVAILSVGFGEYVTAPFYPECEAPIVARKCAACFLILIIGAVNSYSVKVSNILQVAFTLATVMIIFAVIVGGMVQLGVGKTEHLTNTFEGTTNSVSAIAVAFYSGLYAYEGWNTLFYSTEEVERADRNMIISACIGVPAVTVIYIAVNVAYFSVVSPVEILNSFAAAVTFGDRVFGSFNWIVPIAVAFASFAAANGSAFASARLTYAAGRNGHMVEVLSYISISRLTPAPAVMFNAFISIIMILPESATFEALINYFSFASWILYGATFLSVIVLRYRRPNMVRPFKVPLVIPVICTICSMFLVIAPILENPAIEYLYVSIFILAGIIVYLPIVHFKKRVRYMDNVTCCLQQLLEIVPPPKIGDIESNEGIEVNSGPESIVHSASSSSVRGRNS